MKTKRPICIAIRSRSHLSLFAGFRFQRYALWLFTTCHLLFGVAGCGHAEYKRADSYYYRNQTALVTQSYRESLTDTGPNALVGILKLLSASIAERRWEDAEMLATRASILCNVYLGEDSAERDALSLLGQEKDKAFKGEPHEQAMADFYLGLLRYRVGDFEGALAAFRSAINKDRGAYFLPVDSEEARSEGDNTRRWLYADDYAILRFFAAKCYSLLGEPENARRNLELAKEIAPQIAELFDEAMEPSNNVLMVIESGRAPEKRKSGPQGAVLSYVQTSAPKIQRLEVDGVGLSFSLMDDLYDQATTLGGRQVDDLNREKAARRDAIQAAGFAVAATGHVLASVGSSRRNRNVRTAGYAAMGAGILAMIFASAAVDPSADTRAWSLLPRHIYLGVGRVGPTTTGTLAVKAGGQSQSWTNVTVQPENNLYWIRLLPNRSGGIWAPPIKPARPSGPGRVPPET